METTPITTVVETMELSPELEAFADILEFAKYYDATTAAITIRTVNDVPCTFISADSSVKRPKKLLSKTSVERSGPKSGLSRGYAVLGKQIILLCKVTDECDVSYKICYTSATSDKPEVVTLNSDYETVSGEDRLDNILQKCQFTEKNKLIKYMKRMSNNSEILVVIPLKGSKREYFVTKSTDEKNPDICSKKKSCYLTHSLKTYLSVYPLIPKMMIAVENEIIVNKLLVRSLCHAETVDINSGITSTTNRVLGDEEEEERKDRVRITYGFTAAWPGSSCLICYRRGRIVHCVREKVRNRCQYKFVGIVHDIPSTDNPGYQDLLESCIEHYTNEYAAVKPRATRNLKLCEEWQQCVDCLKWREVVNPLEDGCLKNCSAFDMLKSCDDMEVTLLPPLGSNKRPPTTPTSRRPKAGPARVRAGSPVDIEFQSAQKPSAKKPLSRKTPKRKSEGKSPPPQKKIKYVVPDLDSGTEMSIKQEEPAKQTLQPPAKKMGRPRRDKLPAKKLAASLSLGSPPPDGSGEASGTVLDFHINDGENSPVIGRLDGSDGSLPVSIPRHYLEELQGKSRSESGVSKAAEKPSVASPPQNGCGITSETLVDGFEHESDVEDSLSGDSATLQATPIQQLNFSRKMLSGHRSGHSKLDSTPNSSETSHISVGRPDQYFSLSEAEDDDPRTLKIKQLRAELRRANKRVEMLRQPMAQFLNKIMSEDETASNSFVKANSSPEELVSHLLTLTEDSNLHRRSRLHGRMKSSPHKNHHQD